MKDNLLVSVVALLALCAILLSAIFSVLMFPGAREPLPPLVIRSGNQGNAHAEIHNPDPIDRARERGLRQGHYTVEDFTALEGVTDRTFRNWIAAGKIEPVPVQGETGRWEISLDYRLK